MRIEIDLNIFLYSLIGVFAILALSKTNIPIKAYKILLAFVMAIAMPAFFPGHGEFIMLIPNGALFLMSASTAKVTGVVFLIINYFIVWFFIHKLFSDKA